MNEVSHLRRSSAIEQLVSEGWFAGVDWLPEIDSTNSFLKRVLSESVSPKLPRLVVADRQTSGRGRGHNAWWSPEGCLMFSIAWRPDRRSQIGEVDLQSRMSQLPLVVGMSIAGALRAILPVRDSIKVKWPNDVYVEQKKLGGILIESVVGNAEPYWVIGVGVNVFVDIANAPEPIRTKATSLHRECGVEAIATLGVESILLSILPRLQDTLAIWQSNEQFLQMEWPDYCMLSNRWVEIKQSDASLQGICCGIDDRGALILQDPRGRQHVILSGIVESWT